MKSIILVFLIFFSSCATKYIVPGNRFISPESQGGSLNGQFELLQASANQLTINTALGTIDNGVLYTDVLRSGFLLSNSLFEKMDIIWSHTGGSNSLIGGKFQILGASKLAKGSGNKLSAAILVGGNKHETDDKAVEFELSGKEYLVIYGFRVNENILPYMGLSYANYSFDGVLHTNNVLNGLKPALKTALMTLNGGVELNYDSFVLKLESGYQQISTSDTPQRARFLFGYSLGFTW